MDKNTILRQKELRIKGITLIALVVTIIVLLILAGISIVMLTGENGILKRGTEAATKTAHAEVYEFLNLKIADYLFESNNGEYDGSVISYLTSKNIIYTMDNISGYIINVDELLGEHHKYGNGKEGTKDVYKLEEETEEKSIKTMAFLKIAATNSSNKKYKVVYYGNTESEYAELGYVIDGKKPTKLISFRFKENDMQAEEGSTWEEWIKSEYYRDAIDGYGTYSLYIDESGYVMASIKNGVTTGLSVRYVGNSGDSIKVRGTDKIIQDQDYVSDH